MMLALGEMPRVAGFDMPSDLYCVALAPAPLFGMPYPVRLGREGWEALSAAGARGVLCLAGERPRYDPAPLEQIGAVDLDDLVDGDLPRDPATEVVLVRQQVDLVLDRLAQGMGVVVHCAGGTGRTGTVLGAVLVRLGHDPERVLEYLDGLHRARGRAGFPESEWQAEQVRGAPRTRRQG
ncbi:MAG: tyrosine-protein phosphatase [Polyangiaceae bacterium]|nr:tyrosine-protein phosphatase [Polyangiaceae bacterium]